MNSKLKYLPVNWKNGMAFKAEQLNDQYFAILDQLRDARAQNLTTYNFGLLGGEGDRKFADSFHDKANNENAEVDFCRAVTQDGSRIEILHNNWPELKVPLSEFTENLDLNSADYWYVLLVTDPFTRIPEGMEDEQESPRRKPYTRPAYGLEFISQEDLERDSLANAIPVYKYKRTPSGLRKEEHYIPPCSRVNSHKLLLDKYDKYEKALIRLKDDSKKIISKIKSKRRNNKEQNHLADDIDGWCKAYIEFFVSNYDEFKFSLKDQPPIKIVAFFAKLARILMSFESKAHDHDHMLQYFRQYATKLNESELNQLIKDTFQVDYKHFDVAITLKVVDQFVNTFLDIFNNLVNLEFRELAARKVVQKDVIQSGGTKRLSQPRSRIKVRRPGDDDFLGQDLDD